MHEVLTQIGLLGILPLATVEDEESALPLAQTLCRSGLPVIEVTFRTKAAANVIERIAKDSSHMLVGAGTVLTIDQARTAMDAGARFIVSPGFNPKIVEFCLTQSIPILPGIITPTEIQYAIECNLEVVKFFPAEASGGTEYLKAVAAPFKEMKFVPTGGIKESNVLSYLRMPSVLACGGSWMITPEMINAGQYEKIAELTRNAVERAKKR